MENKMIGKKRGRWEEVAVEGGTGRCPRDHCPLRRQGGGGAQSDGECLSPGLEVQAVAVVSEMM